MNALSRVFLVILALALTLGFIIGHSVAQTPSRPDSTVLPPCKFEDSPHCYWDADTMGNGQGHDVVNP